MRIVLLGNSNSILADGWLRTLRRLRPADTVHNLSVGGSPSPALLYQFLSRRSALQEVDLVIVEPTVVDHGESWQNPDSVAGQAVALLQLLRDTGVAVLLMVLPRTAAFAHSPSRGMLAWAAAAAQLQVPLLNLREDVMAHANTLGVPLESLWRDDHGHLVASAQEVVGQRVQAWIDTLEPQGVDLRNGGGAPWRALDGAMLAMPTSLPVVERATSLAQVQCMSLCAGNRIEVGLQPGEAVLGLAVNYGEVDPTEDLTLVAERPDAAPQSISLKNSFLTAKVARKLVVMFVKVTLPVGAGRLHFPDVPAHARLGRDSDQRLEIVGALVGPPIAARTDWKAVGAHALGSVPPAG